MLRDINVIIRHCTIARFTLLLLYPDLRCPDSGLVPNLHQPATLCLSISSRGSRSSAGFAPASSPSSLRVLTVLHSKDTQAEHLYVVSMYWRKGTTPRMKTRSKRLRGGWISAAILSSSLRYGVKFPRGNSCVSSQLPRSLGTWQGDMQHTSSLVLTDISPKVLISSEVAVLLMIITCH